MLCTHVFVASVIVRLTFFTVYSASSMKYAITGGIAALAITAATIIVPYSVICGSHVCILLPTQIKGI